MCFVAQWIRKLFSRKSVNRSVSADEPSVARDDTVHDALNEEFIASNWAEQIIEVFETYTSGQKANSLNEEATFSKQKWVLGYLGTLLTAVTKETDGDRNYKIGLFTFQFVYGAHLGQQLFHRYLNLLKVEDSTIISGGRAAQKDAFEWEKRLENLPQTVGLDDLDSSNFSFLRLIKYLTK